ncbi:MAG TPA: tetratricopeptide repeat protein [Candidatus Acidoferrales bacterium]|nr:tetratricopeptide repeat protein [Candidatus Acidoferrales bacterium]
MTLRTLIFPLLLAAVAPLTSGRVYAAAPPDGAAFQPVPELTAGFRLLYEQNFTDSREIFLAWEKQHPDEPFGHIAVAASYLFEEFYRQGVLTSEFFLNDKKLLHGINGKPDATRMEGFRRERDHAIEAARRRLQKDPKDAEALFALTLAAGMQADALSLLERRNLDSLGQIKEADAYAKRLLAVRPDADDAWLALGIANYIIGCMPSPTRFFLWFGGVHGDRSLGMEQLQKTADKGRYLRPYAMILLALAARREKQHDRARELLRQLKEEFPRSPLFAAEYARAMGQPIPSSITH